MLILSLICCFWPLQDINTTIFSKMDQSLNYVRVNCKLFDTVLCNALEQSLRNIRQTRGHKDVNNEIVLSFREQPRETKVARFTDTRYGGVSMLFAAGN